MYNPMPYEAAREMEVELGIGLREAGYRSLAGINLTLLHYLQIINKKIPAEAGRSLIHYGSEEEKIIISLLI